MAANQEIRLLPGFSVQQGATFGARVGNSDVCPTLPLRQSSPGIATPPASAHYVSLRGKILSTNTNRP
jgi:hypothetical protein